MWTATARWAAAAQAPAVATAPVDRASPTKDIAQNGRTSRHGSLGSRRPQTHWRLSRYETTVPVAVAATFATQAVIPTTVVRPARTVRLMPVVSTDTEAHRTDASGWPVDAEP